MLSADRRVRHPWRVPDPPPAVLPSTLRLGPVDLTVTDLERAVGFYSGALGLRERRRRDGVAVMGTDADDLLALAEDPYASPPRRHAGLFHYALLYPSRTELARAVRRLGQTRTAIQGASDHGVSEAIYLSDPDGHGIELYADRPRDEWPPPTRPGERVGMYTVALDLEGLLDLAAPGESAPGDAPHGDAPPADAPPDPGLRMGHVHLHVGDLRQGLAFYRDVVGFELMTEYPGALFVAAGGYHHHLGFNVWRGEGVGPQPPGTVGLRRWTVRLEDPGELDALRDRARAAGVASEETDRGDLILSDPWALAIAFQVA